MKLLDWGEEGNRTEAEIASLRTAFSQEVSVWHKLDHPNVTKVEFLCTYLFLVFCYKILQQLEVYEFYLLNHKVNLSRARSISVLMNIISSSGYDILISEYLINNDCTWLAIKASRSMYK